MFCKYQASSFSEIEAKDIFLCNVQQLQINADVNYFFMIFSTISSAVVDELDR